jgi:RNA polymerase sigma-70 factor (ECF subfamily)
VKERRLIARASRGDPSAERALYETHVDRVFRLAYRMTGDAELAEDLTQETFVRAFAKLTGFRGDAALATWLHSITTRVVLNALRKVRRLRERETDLDQVEEPPAAATEDHELRRLLHREIDALEDDLRLVFVMHDVEGFKHAEIAAALEIPAGTSKNRLFRARRAIRAGLARAGLDLAREDAS